MSDVELTIAEIEGTLPARRNLVRIAGEPLKIAVAVAGGPDCVLVEIGENSFDECDVTTLGITTHFCRLGGDLIGIWPTPHEDTIIKIKTEISSRRV